MQQRNRSWTNHRSRAVHGHDAGGGDGDSGRSAHAPRASAARSRAPRRRIDAARRAARRAPRSRPRASRHAAGAWPHFNHPRRVASRLTRDRSPPPQRNHVAPHQLGGRGSCVTSLRAHQDLGRIAVELLGNHARGWRVTTPALDPRFCQFHPVRTMTCESRVARDIRTLPIAGHGSRAGAHARPLARRHRPDDVGHAPVFDRACHGTSHHTLTASPPLRLRLQTSSGTRYIDDASPKRALDAQVDHDPAGDHVAGWITIPPRGGSVLGRRRRSRSASASQLSFRLG